LSEEKIASAEEIKKIVAEVSDYLESELAIAEEAGCPNRFRRLTMFSTIRSSRPRSKKGSGKIIEGKI
jgi:hypothetical protein